MPTRDVFPALQESLEARQGQCAAAADAMETGGQRFWMIPPGRGWTGNLFDIAGMAQAFARDEPNQDYAAALHQGGTMADCMAAQVQIDLMAQQERAFRLRHMTVGRSVAHAAGRRRSHGEDSGVHIGSTLQYVQNLLNSGQQATP